ncbi:putative acetyltransferase [Gibbsiella quercinecans]|uniref:Acetyltransferase n=2 Tax=Gibbsiella quercinecans TaxID=929813 RepID=A0A250B0Y5_9GAMM|nr:N-acetyltransferase [Gibbsiella quercinecans]ATA19859.1 acetyltransferase [Gibbsiella quercinecans]RLM04918.1 N-acetyltransferase [Gibbsiella quercinecans]TCT89698.1 putative acetyltransferase [Gibbsiella quercinecans]
MPGLIRAACREDTERLIQLWLISTIAAHPFVPESYWRQSTWLVRERYLPQAKTWVYLHAGSIVGFISILEERFVGGLFVEQAFYGRQVGQALMQFVQCRYRWLSLEVYEENHRACAFYRKQGFQQAARIYNAETHAFTLIMHWFAAAPGQQG